MIDTKKFYQSKGVWGGLIAGIGGGGGIAPILAVMFGFAGYDVSTDEATKLLGAFEATIAAAAGLLAIYGRVTAKTTIER